MKRLFVVCTVPLACLFAFALSSEAQSRLNFPRVLSAQELSSTGFALVNPSSSALVATFNFYGNDGLSVGQSTLTVPAKGQVARLASEILSTVKTSTWVQISSPSTELQGFELVGDFATLVDGAGPAVEATQLAVIDFSREDIIHIVNPGSQTATVQLTLNDSSGGTLVTKSVPLAPFQPASFRLGDLNDDNNIDLVSISANVAVSVSLTTKLPGGLDIGVTNAVPVSSAPSDLFFPFTPTGPQGASSWKTLLGVANLGTTSQTVSVTFTPDGGAPVTIQRNLGRNASLGDSVATLFSTPSSAFTAGWIRVTGTGPLAGAAAYQDSASGSLAIVPSQSSGSTRFFFGHIASLSPWYTGIALLNTTTTAANVEIYALDGSGQLVGSAASFSLAANTRRTALLSEFVPQVLQRASDGGWVFVRTTNNVPLLGFELFGHAIFPILANVQGFALASTSTFTPPASGGTNGVSIDRVSFSDGTSAKTQFQPLNTILYVATIANSSAATGSGQLTFTVTDPRNQTLFTSSSSIPVPASSGDATYSSYIPSNALTGSYIFTATFVYQGQAITKSATFDVLGGSTIPTAVVDPPISVSTTGVRQLVFRPGDTVRFLIRGSNFTSQPVSASATYQLTGPGPLNAGSGSLSFSMPVGLSAQAIDLPILTATSQGLFAFSATVTGGGSTSTKGTVITVVPRSLAETVAVENVFVSDSDGIPRAGFTPGSNILLNIWRLSLFATSISSTVRYTVIGPNSSSVLDQPLAVNIPNGGTLGTVPLTLSTKADAGNYTFQGTTIPEGNTSAASTLGTTFTVGNTPSALTQTIKAMHPYVTDINLVARTSFSPGESLLFFRAVYSSFATPVTGTVQYQVLGTDSRAILDGTIDTTFNPGMNISFVGVTTSPKIPAGSYRLTTTAAAQAQSSGAFTDFAISGGTAPSVSPSIQPDREKLLLSEDKPFNFEGPEIIKNITLTSP